MNSSINIHLCQLNFHVGDLNNNYDKIVSTREKVREKGGDLCIFSELSVTGYPPEDLVLRKTFITSVDKIIASLIELSTDNGPGIIIGYPRFHDNKLMNSINTFFLNKCID